LHPTHRLIWAALNWAKEHGYKQYDLEGLDPDLAHAIAGGDPAARAFGKKHDSFKLSFGGQVVVLPENLEYVYGRIAGWAHRNLWLKFAPACWRRKLVRFLEAVLR
jgi:lipid II:glycine glycyltransferase (peptidoglycan interpeptide bridge formation enzyme)